MKAMDIGVLSSLCLLAALSQPVQAQPHAAPVEKRELIYCADRMTPAEREAYRTKLHAAQSSAEKTALRAAHRAEMQARAASRGQPDACETAGRQWRGGQDK